MDGMNLLARIIGIVGVVLIVVALARIHAPVTAGSVALFALLIVCAAVLLYTVSFLLVTSAFWFVRVDNILQLFNAFIEAGRYPIKVSRGAVRVLPTFFVPSPFIPPVPAPSTPLPPGGAAPPATRQINVRRSCKICQKFLAGAPKRSRTR